MVKPIYNIHIVKKNGGTPTTNSKDLSRVNNPFFINPSNLIFSGEFKLSPKYGIEINMENNNLLNKIAQGAKVWKTLLPLSQGISEEAVLEFLEKTLTVRKYAIGLQTDKPPFSENKELTDLFVDNGLLTKENNFTIREGLLKALFGKILETARPLTGNTKFTNFLFQKYRDLLNKTTELKNNVSYYAKLLNTTPQNLNNICRKSTNQSANDILSVSIIGEAKRLLFYTNNTVSQIAFLLGFNDPSHFVKYFKRLTGYTPQVFRSI